MGTTLLRFPRGQVDVGRSDIRTGADEQNQNRHRGMWWTGPDGYRSSMVSTRCRPAHSTEMPLDETFDEILKAAKGAEEWAWARIYRDLAGLITGYVASRGASDPEDVASETLLQMARNIHSFEGTESSFRSWAFVIAHRRLIDFRRAQGRTVDTTSFDAVALNRAGGDVEHEALDRLVTEEVEATLQTLTEPQRDVLTLRVIAGLTIEETADVVGKRVGAVKALQRRALVTLRKTLPKGVPK